ncbi:MAG: YceI family protein [Actinomycetes bacterium]
MGQTGQIAAGAVPTGTWRVHGPTASVAFTGRVSRLAPTFAARFRDVDGTLHVGADPDDSRVEVDVHLSSMTTGNAVWDDVLTTLDPFQIAMHPVGIFRSERVDLAGPTAVVEGTLTLRGRTAPVRLVGRSCLLDEDRARLVAVGALDRSAFDLRLDVPGGRLLVPQRMHLNIDVEIVRTA